MTTTVARSALDRPKILVFSKKMESYRAAFYQQDFLRELARQADCLFYGPGFPGFELNKSLPEILKGSGFAPDFVLTGHSFFDDNPTARLDGAFRLGLELSPVPVFGFLNKEYSRLEEKMDYFSNVGFSGLFTHHHNLAELTGPISIPHVFLPFAVNPDRFPFSEKSRKYDVGFAGILRNPSFKEKQPDTREQIMRELFFSAFNTPILKKPRHRGKEILWKSWTGKRLADLIGAGLGHGKLSETGYKDALASTKVWINSPSPLDLVSTRYFECMASGSFILAQESPGLATVFPPGLMATYRDALEFPAVLESALLDGERRERVAQEARDHVLGNHTWAIRVEKMLETVAGIIR